MCIFAFKPDINKDFNRILGRTFSTASFFRRKSNFVIKERRVYCIISFTNLS